MSVAVAAPASPYKGLAPFEDSDADALLFFGRERESEVIAANLIASRLTVLYGPSGVGKSSVLRAGVAHRLRREQEAEVIVFATWTGDPVAALVEAAGGTGRDLPDVLADAADRAGGDLYVILDQFEELFLYHKRGGEFAQQLARVLRRRGLRVNVLIGMREDSLARLDALKAAIPNLLANRLRLDRLDRAAGAAAIVGPLARYNELVPSHERVEIDPELEEAILDQVTAGRVELAAAGRGVAVAAPDEDRIEAPYLQLVLTRLWEVERARGSHVLRLATLAELGGAEHIVEAHLEQAMAALSPREKGAAAAMYHFLVTPSGTKIAHGVDDLAGYAALPEQEAAGVLQRLTAERIVRASSENGPSTTRYEIFHDVLAGAVVAWRTRYEAERALEEERVEHRRRQRRLLVIFAASLLAFGVMAAIAVYALAERGRARHQAHHARAGQLVAEARTMLDVDPRQSIALALRAAGLERSGQVEDALRDSLLASRVRAVVAAEPIVARGPGFFVTVDRREAALKIRNDGRIVARRGLTAPVTVVAVTPDGAAVAARRGGSLAVIHPHGVVNDFAGWPPAAPVSALAFGRNGLAEGSENGTVRTWVSFLGKSHTRRVRGRVKSLAFSPDGRQVLVVSRDRAARLVNTRTGRIEHVLLHKAFVNAAAFSPNGRVVATGAQDWTGRIWDARTGRLLHELAPATGGITAIAFSPDGKLVALASADGVARIYDVKAGAIRFYLSGDTNAINDISFSPDGRALVTASSDRTVRVWTTDVGRQLAVLRGHTDAVQRAFFTSDGTRVVTAAADGTVRIWDPGTEPELRVVFRQQRRFAQASRDRSGTITALDTAGITRMLDPTARHVVRTVRGRPPQPRRAEASRGDLNARAGPDDVVTVTRNNETLHVLSASADALEFSPDGRLLAAGGHDDYLRVWDVQSGRLLYAVVAHQGPVEDVSFSPDGRWIVTAGPISAGVWRADSGHALFPLPLRGPTQPLHAALFTRDGRTIVTAGYDGTIRRYDCDVCGTFGQLVKVGEQRLAQTSKR